MSSHMKALLEAIKSRTLHQELKGKVKNHPVIHFSDNAEKIIAEGFLFGESGVHALDLTTDAGTPKEHVGPGYNFGFNAIEWDVENDCFDYEVATEAVDRGLMGMISQTAVLLQVDGIYTRHYDEFHQVIFWGPDAKTDRSILLRNVGGVEIDGEIACDDNGNEVDCWTATTAEGVCITRAEDLLTLRECVLMSLIHLDKVRQLSRKQSSEYRELYEGEIEELALASQLPELSEQSSKKHAESSIEP